MTAPDGKWLAMPLTDGFATTCGRCQQEEYRCGQRPTYIARSE